MKTTNIDFDAYDTRKLIEVRKVLNKTYEYNYGSSRKVTLLGTVIRKLDNLIWEYGNREELYRGLDNIENPHKNENS